MKAPDIMVVQCERELRTNRTWTENEASGNEVDTDDHNKYLLSDLSNATFLNQVRYLKRYSYTFTKTLQQLLTSVI